MSGSVLTVKAVVAEGEVIIPAGQNYDARKKRHAKTWGDGCALVIRIEPEEDAYTYGQIKHYWGHVVDPFCETTGYHKHEAHALLKAECMPEGKTSITELSGEELRAYTDAAEQKAREWCPDAFALMDERRSA